ncbi:MAG: isoprenyl transferase [Alphaproteobacteria bacterium]|nr:isoprenyl transferase [Alphaproteobacteria bacterium]
MTTDRARHDAPVPRHVAIIMDGNGRWAQRHGLPRTAGHEAGAESVREVVRACGELGVDVLTLYSFSTENWARPEDEVWALMGLLERYLREETGELLSNGVRLRGIGELDQLPDHVRQLLRAGEALTADNQGMELLLALSYGARAELVAAVRELAQEVRDGELEVEAIDEDLVASRLYTAGLPDPDLLIRTSGDLRLSNFLLWQVAYAELYVTPVPWPEFRRPHLLEAFAAYGERQRRFGKTGDQVETDP